MGREGQQRGGEKEGEGEMREITEQYSQVDKLVIIYVTRQCTSLKIEQIPYLSGEHWLLLSGEIWW